MCVLHRAVKLGKLDWTYKEWRQDTCLLAPYTTKRMVKVGASAPRAGGTQQLKKLDKELRDEYQEEAVAATGLSLATVKVCFRPSISVSLNVFTGTSSCLSML